jgi:hypothetical protein
MKTQIHPKALGLTIMACLLAVVAQGQLLQDTFNAAAIDASLWQTATPFSDSMMFASNGFAVFKNRGRLLSVADLPNAIDVRGRFAFATSSHDSFVIQTRCDGGATSPTAYFDRGIEFGFSIQGDDGQMAQNVWIYRYDYPNRSPLEIKRGTFPMTTNVFYDFRLTDDGTNTALYVNDLSRPLIEGRVTDSLGHRLGLFNREGAGGGAPINAGGAVQLDYLIANPVLPSNPALPSLKIYPAIELEFATDFGRCYSIQYSTDLATWSPLGGPVIGTGGTYNLLLSTKNTEKRFYRLTNTFDLSPGLVASYRFDGSATDCSINGNHGIANNVTLTTNRFGRANAAYRFAGTSDSYIRVPNSPSLNVSKAITLAAWINFEVGGTVFPRILNKNTYELATGEAFRSERRFFLTLNEGATATQLGTANDVLQAGRWHFVVGTYDGTLMLLYVDGVLAAATVVHTEIRATDFDLNIGRTVPSGEANYKGLIDDVRIYDRALSASEITMLMNEPD